MNLILLEPPDMDEGTTAVLTGARARHAIQVLKAAVGQTVRIGMLNGPLGTGTIVEYGAATVILQCRFDSAAPPRPRLDLLLALPRPKVLQRLWAQFSALGLGQVILTNAARVERDYFDTHVVTEDCYRPLLIEGLQQARDTWLPAVSVHKRFRLLIEDGLPSLFPRGHRIVAHPGCGSRETGLKGLATDDRVLLAVGPEGGWNDFELKLLATHGFRLFDIGGRTLRTDTACIALLALIHAAIRNSELRNSEIRITNALARRRHP